MEPDHPDETIRCLLCRGVVLFTQSDQERYKDHLNKEHRVFFYLSWIIDKTIEVDGDDKVDKSHKTVSITPSLPSVHPSVSITPMVDTEDEDHHSLSIIPVETELVEFEDDNLEYDDDNSNFGSDDLMYTDTYDNFVDASDNIGDTSDNISDISHNMGDNTPDGFEIYEGHNSYDFTDARILVKRSGRSKQFGCSSCPHLRPWPSLHKALRHQVTHIPLAFRKMIQCPECKERFINEKNLKRHIDENLCKGLRYHRCTKCNLTFDSRYDLLEHEEVHGDIARKLKCSLCGAKFKAQKYLKKHMSSHSNVKPFSCDICKKAFKSEYYVKTHRKSHFENSSFSNKGNVKYEAEEEIVECIPELNGLSEDHQADIEIVHVEC